VFPQLKIAIGDLLLIDAIELHVLPQDEQPFLSPVPLQALGHISGVAFTPDSTKAAPFLQGISQRKPGAPFWGVSKPGLPTSITDDLSDL
jgi:hypothetical protein